jgi:hypothetical protein
MPYEPEPDGDAPMEKQLDFHGSREVRHTVIRVITAHLRNDAAVSWQGLNFDFTGVVFDGGDFDGAQFSGGAVDFIGARFSGGTVSFTAARFCGGTVDFRVGRFSGGTVDFGTARFCGGTVDFRVARFCGGTVDFRHRRVLRRHGRLQRSRRLVIPARIPLDRHAAPRRQAP